MQILGHNALVVASVGIVVAAFILTTLLAMMFRVVVSTNDVHIVQSGKKTISYGKGETAGNVYYRWPSWVPVVGVKTINLPMSVFDVSLDGYAAYDKGRVPFVIDIMAFFRITDSNHAAQRVHSFVELQDQLKGILQGAVRTILAKSEIEEILEGRSTFGEAFTREVDANLGQWGIQTVKCIELMDIRDGAGSTVIANIMAKKSSLIDRESRIEVANNKRSAELAEIDARREVDIRRQEATQLVGVRTQEQEREVGIAAQRAQQQVLVERQTTTQREMDVKRVNDVASAEIARDVQVVAAEQQKRTMIIKAEGDKQEAITIAEGDLQKSILAAQGIEAEGRARGVAETAILMAPVDAQIALAKEISASEPYQKYLIAIRTVEKDEVVGKEQAEALAKAEIKVIANGADAVSGMTTAAGVLSSTGGTKVGAMLEGLANTPMGKALMTAIVMGRDAVRDNDKSAPTGDA